MVEPDKLIDKFTSGGVPLVFAVARVGSSIFVGWSSKKTSPKYHRIYPSGDVKCSRHAEMHVLNKLPKSVKKSRVELFVFRVRPGGGLGMARPCIFCQSLLKKSGIKPHNIWYTDWDGEWKRLDKWSTTLKDSPPPLLQEDK